MKKLLSILLTVMVGYVAAATTGCTASKGDSSAVKPALTADASPSAKVPVTKIGAKGTVMGEVTATLSLCQLVKWSRAGIGVYQVKSLATSLELAKQTPDGVPSEMSFGYVELALVDAWTADTPKSPSLRIWRCGEEYCPVKLSAGDQVVLFLDVPSENNEGYYNTTTPLAWLQRPSGTWSNGELYSKQDLAPADLKTQVQTLAQAVSKNEACPFDVLPDNKPAEEQADASDPVYGDAEVELECVECPAPADTGSPDIGK